MPSIQLKRKHWESKIIIITQTAQTKSKKEYGMAEVVKMANTSSPCNMAAKLVVGDPLLWNFNLNYTS